MLAWVAQRLATYGYGAVALVVMGESLGLPRAGETRLFLGGASASAGYLESWGSSWRRQGGPWWAIPSAMNSGDGAGGPSWSAMGT
jgi:hypothetical protein